MACVSPYSTELLAAAGAVKSNWQLEESLSAGYNESACSLIYDRGSW